MNPQFFISDEHALYAGWVVGSLIAAGIGVTPIVDDNGDYTDRLTIEVVDPKRRPPVFVVTLIVPPPPDDWTFGA